MTFAGGNGRDHGAPFRLGISIQDAAARLHGRIERDRDGREVIRCPGPGHSKHDLSLSVWLDPDEPGGIGVHSFSAADAGDPLALKDWVREQLGLPGFKPGRPKTDTRDPDPIVAKYEYQTAMGEPVLLVNRTSRKAFYQQRPDGAGGWSWGGITDPEKVPFKLPDLIEAIALGRTVYICEGEKACLALIDRGYAATCSPGGAGKWPKHFAQWFGGASAVILADNDEPGRKHADRVEANLAGIAQNVRIVQLPGLKPGGDVFDYLAAGGDPAAIAQMRAGPPPRGVRAADLWAMDFPAIRYAVPDYIAEGLTLLAGAPKRGKSWLALDLCCAVATGGFTLGDRHCAEGDVLYCALEDSPRRMRSRLKVVCQANNRPPDRLTIWFGADLPRLGAGCEDALKDWLASATAPRLIVIDTLNYIRPERVRDEDPYSYDYRSAVSLQRIAGEFGVAIVLVHHTRKSAADDYLESVSGTNGLTGGCDAVTVLERQGDGSTVFRGRGRDVEEFEIAVKFDKEICRWSVLGEAAEAKKTGIRDKILKHLGEVRWLLTPSEIASQTGLTRAQVDLRLFRLVLDGEVIKAAHGKYCLPDIVIDGDGPDA